MTVDYVGPNQRGNAKRDPSKVVRCGTHLPVLERVFNTFGPKSAVEHGCGLNSTKFFAERCETFVSIEDVPSWRIDVDQPIVGFVEYMKDPLCADCFLIDGRNETERLAILNVILERNLATYIVLHDAESYSMHDEIVRKVKECGYSAFQYVASNPETFLFVKNDVDMCRFDLGGYVTL